MREDETDHIARELAGKTWEELEAVEHEGRLYFPEVIYRRVGKKFEAEPVRLLVLREHEVRRAKRMARKWAADEKLDPALDPQLFDNMVCWCELALSIRNTTFPYESLHPDPAYLEANYDKRPLVQVYAKIDAYARLLDPRPEEIDAEQMVALVAALAKEQTIRPLVAFDGVSQTSCILYMARELQSLRDSKSSSESSDFSTAAD